MKKIQFKLSAPSMVYGENLAENIDRLATRLDHIEIVLFHTPELHNLPDPATIAMLRQMAAEKQLTYSVHLPASLEIASADRATRAAAIRLAMDCFYRTAVLNPVRYVLHVPCTPPTLTAVPGCYFKPGQGRDWEGWTARGLAGLEILEKELAWSETLLVENINFSPDFLSPYLESGLCRLCLDIGHLVLGKEDVDAAITRFAEDIREIHLHGVCGHTDHIGLGSLPEPLVHGWLRALEQIGFDGILNLEVFSPADLVESMAIVAGAAGVRNVAG